MNNTFLKLVASATLLVASASSFAITTLEPITGVIGFTGMSATTVKDGKITAIDFLSAKESANDNGKMIVANTTGTFNEVSSNKAQFFDLVTTNNNPMWTVNAADLLWTVDGFTFTINNITANRVIAEFGGFAGIVATGTIAKDGYAETAAQFTYTTQNTKDGTATEHTFSATTVPAPATIALLGLALVGFGAARRKKQA